MNWNPGPHAKHAWESTSTVWGKIALILFYSFIWLGIISSVWSLIDPTSQGVDCMLNQIPEEDSDYRDVIVAFIRSMDVLWIGLFAYADASGLHTKNIAVLSIVTIGYSVAIMGAGAPESCPSMNWMWIFPVWVVLSLIFMIMEDKLGDHGTSAERTPLHE